MLVFNPVSKQRRTSRMTALPRVKIEPDEHERTQILTVADNNDDDNLICLSSGDEDEVDVEDIVCLENTNKDKEKNNNRNDRGFTEIFVTTSPLREDCNNNENNEPKSPSITEDDILQARNRLLETSESDDISEILQNWCSSSLKIHKSTQTYEIDFPEKQQGVSTARSEVSFESLGEENNHNHPQRSLNKRTRQSTMCLRPEPYPTFGNCSNYLPSDLANNQRVQSYINWRLRGLTRQYESRILQGFMRFMNYVTHNPHQSSNQNNSNNHGFNQQNTNTYGSSNTYGYNQQNTNNYRSNDESNFTHNQNTNNYRSNDESNITHDQNSNNYRSNDESNFRHNQNTNNSRSNDENNFASNQNTRYNRSNQQYTNNNLRAGWYYTRNISD